MVIKGKKLRVDLVEARAWDHIFNNRGASVSAVIGDELGGHRDEQRKLAILEVGDNHLGIRHIFLNMGSHIAISTASRINWEGVIRPKHVGEMVIPKWHDKDYLLNEMRVLDRLAVLLMNGDNDTAATLSLAMLKKSFWPSIMRSTYSFKLMNSSPDLESGGA